MIKNIISSAEIKNRVHKQIKDRVRGLIYGGVLGNTLGASRNQDFGKLEHSRRGCGVELVWDPSTSLFSRKILTYSGGQVTDDAEMVFCIFESLLNNYGHYCQDFVIKNYIGWANSGVRSIRKNTRELFNPTISGLWEKGLAARRARNLPSQETCLKYYKNRFVTKFSTQNKKDAAQSNSAMMRCGILALFGFQGEETHRAVIIQDCDITNPNSLCQEANYILTKAIYGALRGQDKSIIFENALRSATHEKIVLCLVKARAKKNINVDTKKKGWCLYALFLAFYSLLHFDSFKAGMDNVISRKGDTDTNCFIAGYLLGAYYGLEKMKEDTTTSENIEVLVNCTQRESTEQRPRKFWTSTYLPNKTEDLLELLVNPYISHLHSE